MSKPSTDRQALARDTVLLVVAAFIFASLPHLIAMPVWLALIIVGGGIWRVVLSERIVVRPHWLLRAALTFGALALVVLHYGAFWGRRAATVMLCLMIAAKLTEMDRLRDARVVAALGYFLIATQFLFSQELLLFGYLLIGVALCTAALARVQRDAEGAGPAGVEAIRPPLEHGARLLLFALPFALVMFMLFPRLSSPLWGVPEQALDGKTGLADSMSPGAIANLFIDDSPAFRVQFQGAPPPAAERYWRGPVLWNFDGRTWRRMRGSERRERQIPRAGPNALAYSVQLEPNERRWLFTLDYPAAWPDDATLHADFELIRDRPVTSVIAYEVVSQPDFVDSPALPEHLRRAALALPVDSNPRTRALAAQLRRQHPDDQELVQAVLDWFNTDEFYYNLQTAPLGRNGADEFLFDLKVGYCEYYASAFAILMRATGIPTRVVTGYQGGFWQSNGGYLLVRQSDAHAWTEVWLPGRGWVRVDPTAAVSPERIVDGARAALPAARGWMDADWLYALRNQYDRLRHFWNDWILGFNAERQTRLLDRLGLGGLPLASYAVVVIVLALLVLVPLLWLWRNSGENRPDRLEQSWRRLLRRLRRKKIDVSGNQTPREISAHLAVLLDNGNEFASLVEDYQKLRYGPAPTAENIADLRRRMRIWTPRAREL